MIIALCILVYLFIGWMVASACLALSIHYQPKRDPKDSYIDFVIPFFFWWLVLIGFFIYYSVNIVLWLGHKMEILITKIRKKKYAFNDSEICDKYEYDESGLRKIYGWCCGTCVNSNRKECPKTKGKIK